MVCYPYHVNFLYSPKKEKDGRFDFILGDFIFSVLSKKINLGVLIFEKKVLSLYYHSEGEDYICFFKVDIHGGCACFNNYLLWRTVI